MLCGSSSTSLCAPTYRRQRRRRRGKERSMSGDEAYRRAVGRRIRVWRAMQDRTQEDLAAAAGVTRNFVSAIERGAQGLDAVRLRKLAAEMGMSMADLLAEPSGESRWMPEPALRQRGVRVPEVDPPRPASQLGQE